MEWQAVVHYVNDMHSGIVVLLRSRVLQELKSRVCLACSLAVSQAIDQCRQFTDEPRGELWPPFKIGSIHKKISGRVRPQPCWQLASLPNQPRLV